MRLLKMTAQWLGKLRETTMKTIEQMVQQEVSCCLSSLVSTLATLVPTFVALVSILVAVPAMVVFEPTATAVPITGNKPPPVVVRLNPIRALIRRSRPVARVPPIA